MTALMYFVFMMICFITVPNALRIMSNLGETGIIEEPVRLWHIAMAFGVGVLPVGNAIFSVLGGIGAAIWLFLKICKYKGLRWDQPIFKQKPETIDQEINSMNKYKHVSDPWDEF
jgi:hypothetical protein